MLTKQDILNDSKFVESEDGKITLSHYTNHIPWYITVGNNTYHLHINKSGDNFRQELPDTIQQLIKQINRYKDHSLNPNSSLKTPKYEYGTTRNKLKTFKAKKNWY